MAWAIRFEKAAAKELSKLDREVARWIVRFLSERVAELDNSREIGEARKGSSLGEFWKYRVGDYRVICKIVDSEITIVVIRLGNRREVYR